MPQEWPGYQSRRRSLGAGREQRAQLFNHHPSSTPSSFFSFRLLSLHGLPTLCPFQLPGSSRGVSSITSSFLAFYIFSIINTKSNLVWEGVYCAADTPWYIFLLRCIEIEIPTGACSGSSTHPALYMKTIKQGLRTSFMLRLCRTRSLNSSHLNPSSLLCIKIFLQCK